MTPLITPAIPINAKFFSGKVEVKSKSLLKCENTKPAIHPRYRASYSELYGEEEAEQGSLGIRTFICMILFAVFVFMQNEGKDILHISSTKVVQEVSKNADITDVWKKIP